MNAQRLHHACPYCRGPMTTTAMTCPSCKVEVRGEYYESFFQKLSPEDLQTLEDYLLSGFSIKALEERTGMGYTALRSRIDRLIENYKRLADDDTRRTAILDDLAAGILSADQAAERLRQLSIPHGEKRA